MPTRAPSLQKARTGIEGLDEITHGGLPKGRTTLVSGSAGAGKTVFGIEFLVHGALMFDEPGVFITFVETEKELAQDVASFGFDLEALQEEGKLAIEHVHLDREDTAESGEYDLEGLFIRLARAVEAVHAKRVVLDTIEVLFSALKDQSAVRSELLRLFRWLKDHELTSVVTSERGNGILSRLGIEEYVADCVILLDHRVTDQISTRRIRVVKYRGSRHEMDEHPFLMGESGISVIPVTSAALDYNANTERVSSGVPGIDAMLSGLGFFRGSSILVSGTTGTGKTTLALTFLAAGCERGETALYIGFEESLSQIVRNMRSIGLDLETWQEKGLLHFNTLRASSLGLEAHLASIMQSVKNTKPRLVAIDPMSDFLEASNRTHVKSMITRLVDFLKLNEITALFTRLPSPFEQTEVSIERISSLVDTVLILRHVERGNRHSKFLHIMKSRGMNHSSNVAELILTGNGIRISEPQEEIA